MGSRSLVSRETCLNFLGLRCDVCYRVCPVIDKAITLETRHNARTGKHAIFEPIVHADACTGCGKCEKCLRAGGGGDQGAAGRARQAASSATTTASAGRKRRRPGGALVPGLIETAQAHAGEQRHERHAHSRSRGDARATAGWIAHRFLVLRAGRRNSASSPLFLTGPLFGVWIVKGTLASSLTLDVLPLTDPLIAAAEPRSRGTCRRRRRFTGAAIVLAVYLLLGGRTYCCWVCPVNPVTDLAAWLRRRLRASTRAG